MILLISGTDRPNSNTSKIAAHYRQWLTAQNIEHQFLSLEDVDLSRDSSSFQTIQSNFLIPATKFIIVMPEYNGSFPGIVKLMIDRSDVKACWHHKKILMTGVASGRAGNLRGMEHLTGAMLYLKMNVHPNRLPISTVDRLLDADGNITDEETRKAIQFQLQEFIAF
jgi:NAD(P)H-dependent FMN reductase